MKSFLCRTLTLSIVLFCLNKGHCFPEEHSGESHNSYDFIIVGGGTAGSVLANRLSKDYSVLVLEAGGRPPSMLNIPGLAIRNKDNPNFTFRHRTTRQKYGALGTNGGVVTFPVGRVLGGSSQLNYMVVNRGSPLDYDNWANLTHDDSWNYSNMLKYFKRLETYLGRFPDAQQHGFNGPIPVTYNHEHVPGREEWLEAGKELGFQIRDANGPQQISFTPVEFNKRFGRRVSAYVGYLKPIMGARKNLHVVTNAYVTRLILRGNTAIGVRYNDDGSFSYGSPRAQLAFAKREVIVSAGAYGSSTLLMRSGIGPRNVLRAAGVPLVKELPVGRNWMEHPLVTIPIIVNNKSYSLDPAADYNPGSFRLFQQFGTGPYAKVGVGDAGQAFLSSSIARAQGHSDWSDIMLTLWQSTSLLEPFRKFEMAPWETSLYVMAFVGRGYSRGTVTLNPKNVDGLPVVDPNFLGDERDVQILLEGIDATLNIVEGTKAFRKLGARFPADPVPACSHLQFRSRAYWTCFSRQTLFQGYHPSGTCSMNSVVDSSLRVFGMKGLRVVDASVIPEITNANLHFVVLATAEKSADVILREYR